MIAAASDRFTGWLALARLALRRDRALIPIWVAVFTLMAGGSAAATIDLYPEPAARRLAVAAVNGNPTLVALYGRIHDPDSLGALSLFKATALGAALVGVLAIILVVRHTRADEESGRLELVRAGVVGRLAALAAALVTAAVALAAIAAATTVVLIATGLPPAGAVTFGLCWAMAGLAFAAVAAITAQLTTSARAATGLALAVLGASYVVRGIGDAAGAGGLGWLSWLSPVGWAQQARPFAGDRWWALGLGLVFTAAALAGAFALAARRDLGAGLLTDRPGPAAARRLGGPFALAWRLQRGTLMAWAVTYALLGAILGGLASSVDGFLQSSRARDFIITLGGGQTGLVDAFFATELGMLGVITSAFAIQAVLRLHAEEAEGRAEALLATSLGRRRWMASHAVVALGGAVALLAVGGVAAGLARAADSGDPWQIARLIGAALAQAPAVAVLVGVTMTAFGLSPRTAVAGWAALVIALLLGELGPLFHLPPWLMDLSPFAHVPRLPGSSWSVAPLIGLVAVAIAFAAAGLEAFRRRDLG